MEMSTVIEIVTAGFSAYSALNAAKLKAELMSMKLWIIQNFHAKENAEFDK